MTSYTYRSVFSDESSYVPSSDGSVVGELTPGQDPNSASGLPRKSTAGFASFICHVAHLEEELGHGDKSTFFEGSKLRRSTINQTRLGYGASFVVDRAELQSDDSGDASGTTEPSKSKVVVVKTVREDPRNPNEWRDVLFEIRVLLHEPIRYHPNIVRLIDIGWNASSETGSPFPTLIQEYADFGTLDRLQADYPQLPFSIKQKLCYDVGRGLSILHGCGIVHGDLKHENTLVFTNRYANLPGQPYTAKIADFGGTVMEVEGKETYTIPMSTFPYEAPEAGEKLSADGLKKTDAFSYGMLIWRCMVDCRNVLTSIGVALGSGKPTEQDRKDLNRLKASDALVEGAISDISTYFISCSTPTASLQLVISALMHTLRGDPANRALDRAQARLRGMAAVDAYQYVTLKDAANTSRAARLRNRTPGKHGIDMDSIGYSLGRIGDDYDAQNNLPGYRPDLPHPRGGGFLFEPLKLRKILDWNQQKRMVAEFEDVANSATSGENSADMQPWSAAFYLYQSYLSGFGAPYDAEKACDWLRRAADPAKEAGSVDYLARAWLFRVHAALGVPNPLSLDAQVDNLWWSIIRGHRHCVGDTHMIIESITNPEQKQKWHDGIEEADWNYRRRTSASGMPYFISRKLTRKWDLEDLDLLDLEIRRELGNQYESSLRQTSSDGHASTMSGPPPEGGYRFDRIYVNHKGHGLLHLAASFGNVTVLRHLYRKYQCDINIENQSHSDTPLTCACRSGHYDCVVFCLDNGADPNGSEFSQESPLHCVHNFQENEVKKVVQRLVDAGADLEKHSHASRKDVRRILADWEDNLRTTLTPLGRAVLYQSFPAVRALLDAGANPTTKRMHQKQENLSAVELAAILTLPDILQILLDRLDNITDSNTVSDMKLFDESGMLEAARSGNLVTYDPLSLQSRLVRCGVHYSDWLDRTLRILHKRSQALHMPRDPHTIGASLCFEVSLGNHDIVKSLLDLGHPVDGSSEHRPIKAAVRSNHVELFRLLIDRGSSLVFPEDEEPGQLSLLQVFAQRPRHSPRDTFIAELLIEHGFSVEHSAESVHSPLVLAIEQGYFDLAELLLSKGAGPSMNGLPDLPGGRSLLSLLGRLLQKHTFSTLESIAFISQSLKKYPHVRLNPVVDETAQLTAVHLLALTKVTEWNHHSQISARIVQHVLEMFPDPASLREYAIHPRIGSPFSAAALTGNTYMLDVLLDSKYAVYLQKQTHIEYPLGTPSISGTFTPENLIWELLRLTFERSAASGEITTQELHTARQQIDAGLKLARVGNSSDGTDKSTESIDIAMAEVEAKLKALQRKAQHRQGLGERDGAAHLPVDLSVLSEEKPSGRVQGEEMTIEMSFRVFLKSYRTEESIGDPITLLMDKTFNKRQPEPKPSTPEVPPTSMRNAAESGIAEP